MANSRGAIKLQPYILQALHNSPETRDNDRLLYLTVLFAWGNEHGLDPLSMTVREFYTGEPLPDYQSVVRIRRKMQALFPEYRSTKQKEKYRAEQESDWRAWANG